MPQDLASLGAATAPLVALLASLAAVPCQIPLGSIDGTTANERLGSAVGAVFDRRPPSVVREDWLLIGAPGPTFFTPQGRVDRYRWSPLGWVAGGFQSVGASGSAFGSAIDSGRDTNGDLVTDFVVGAPQAAALGANTGEMSLLSGLPAGFAPITSRAGLAAGCRGGTSVALLGNVDGAGSTDVGMGAPDRFFGACFTSWVCGSGPGHTFGAYSITDVTAVAPHWQPTGRDAGACGACYNDRVGRAVGSLGDLDRDGFDDVAVGNENHRAIYVGGRGPTGTTVQLKYTLVMPAVAGFGSAIAGLGDIDGDLEPDFCVGAVASGRVYLFSGAAIRAGAAQQSPPPILATIDFNNQAPNGSGEFGRCLANAGDCDGDGVADIAVGAPDWDGVGQAFLFSGGDRRLLGYIRGDAAGDRMGESVTGTPDFTGDGRNEFAAGAPGWDAAGVTDAGTVRVMTLHTSGHPRASLTTGTGCSPTPVSRPIPSLPNGRPYVNHATFAFGLATGTTGQSAALVIGLAPQVPPIPLPTPWPCSLHVVGSLLIIPQVGGLSPALTGQARQPLAIPNWPGLAGVTILAQWYAINLGGTAFHGSMTDVVTVTIEANRSAATQ